MSGYTIPYGREYHEWVEEKAKRIQKALRFLYLRGLPIDKQFLAENIYIERLLGIGHRYITGQRKWGWKPLANRFLDFKPSPFIKNFIDYLILELVDRGYVANGWVVELRDRIRVNDREIPLESSVVRIYREGVFRRVVELRDRTLVKDMKTDIMLTPLKIVVMRTGLGTQIINITVRESTHVTEVKVDGQAQVAPPEARYEKKVLRVPSLDVLKEICTWSDPL